MEIWNHMIQWGSKIVSSDGIDDVELGRHVQKYN